MADIDRQIRRGATRFLDYSAQQTLLQRQRERDQAEKERTARATQQRDINENITKLALGLQSPAGVEATRQILGNRFDANQELDFRRLQGVLEPALKSEQYGVLNPLGARVGLPQTFAPSDLSRQRTATESFQGDAAKALAEQRRVQAKLQEGESRARISKINSDLKLNKTKYAKTITDLMGKVSQGNVNNADLTRTLSALDKFDKDYAGQLEDLQGLADYEIEDPDSGETITNPKYAGKISELQKAQQLARDKKNQLFSVILGSTGDAEKVDQATGGAVAGNAAENTRQRLAMQLLKTEFPEVAAQIEAEQQPRSAAQAPSFLSPNNISRYNERTRQAIQEALSQPSQQQGQAIKTPDGKVWRKNANGTYTQIR